MLRRDFFIRAGEDGSIAALVGMAPMALCGLGYFSRNPNWRWSAQVQKEMYPGSMKFQKRGEKI